MVQLGYGRQPNRPSGRQSLRCAADRRFVFMNKLLRYSFLAVAIGVLASTGLVAEGRGQDVLREVLKRLDTNNKSLQSLQASITIVKFNSQLNIPDTSYGSTSYLPKTTKHVM